jgi:hypothetical protein
MGVRNDIALLSGEVGLLSEEYDPPRRQLVGNFPQAFSHVALINGAFNLTTAQLPIEQRSQHAEASVAKRSKARSTRGPSPFAVVIGYQ